MTPGTFVLELILAAKIGQGIRASLGDGSAIDRGRFKDIFLVQVISVIPGLFGSSSQAALSAVGSTGIALLHIGVQIGLHLCDGCVPGLSENHIIKFFLDDLVEAFLAAVGLRVTRLCPGMLDVVQMKEQLVGMPHFCSRVIGSSVGQCRILARIHYRASVGKSRLMVRRLSLVTVVLFGGFSLSSARVLIAAI